MITFQQFMTTYPNETACRQFLADHRWPDGVKCPRCGKGETVYKIAQPWKWECSNIGCRSGNAYRFSLLVGTIFENTKHPLVTWFKVLYTILQSKKGVSSRQLRRMFIGEIARKGNVTCAIIEDTSMETMSRFVRKAVSDRVSLVATDEGAGYRKL